MIFDAKSIIISWVNLIAILLKIENIISKTSYEDNRVTADRKEGLNNLVRRLVHLLSEFNLFNTQTFTNLTQDQLGMYCNIFLYSLKLTRPQLENLKKFFQKVIDAAGPLAIDDFGKLDN